MESRSAVAELAARVGAVGASSGGEERQPDSNTMMDREDRVLVLIIHNHPTQTIINKSEGPGRRPEGDKTLFTMKKLVYLSGKSLTNGAYLGYHTDVYSTIASSEPETLGLSALMPQYSSAIRDMQQVVNAPKALQESKKIAVLDEARDQYWLALYRALTHLSRLPINDELYPQALLAYTTMKKYEGLQDHEYMKESEEISGVIRDGSEPDVIAALKALGLETLFNRLIVVNNELRALYKERASITGDILDTKDGRTTAELRAALKTILEKVARRLDAKAELTDDAEELKVIEKLINDVNGLAEHYRKIQAMQGRKVGEDETPEVPEGDVPAPEE